MGYTYWLVGTEADDVYRVLAATEDDARRSAGRLSGASRLTWAKLEDAAEREAANALEAAALKEKARLCTAFAHGWDDATTVLRQSQQDADEEARAYGDEPERIPDGPGWRGDWTEGLLNATTAQQREDMGLDTPGALAAYQRGALEAVEGFFKGEVED